MIRIALHGLQAAEVERIAIGASGSVGGDFGIRINGSGNSLVSNGSIFGRTIRPKSGWPVSDDGDGLPNDFEPTASTGLGMKIVRALVDRIDGELHWSGGEDGKGARFEVTFSSGPIETGPAAVEIAKESR